MILDTSTPNSLAQTPPLVPPEYQYLVPGSPCLTPEPGDSSEETAVEEDSTASQTSSAIQAKIAEIIWRVKHQIDLDQVTFNNLTYRHLRDINQIHCQDNPHLYPLSNIPDDNKNPTIPQELQEDREEKEEDKEIIIMRTDSSLPIQDLSSQYQTQLEEGTLTEGSTLRDLSQTTSKIVKRWTPSLRTIPRQEEWNQWLELRIEEAFQGE